MSQARHSLTHHEVCASYIGLAFLCFSFCDLRSKPWNAFRQAANSNIKHIFSHHLQVNVEKYEISILFKNIEKDWIFTEISSSSLYCTCTFGRLHLCYCYCNCYCCCCLIFNPLFYLSALGFSFNLTCAVVLRSVGSSSFLFTPTLVHFCQSKLEVVSTIKSLRQSHPPRKKIEWTNIFELLKYRWEKKPMYVCNLLKISKLIFFWHHFENISVTRCVNIRCSRLSS